jgi:hypothetical protein
MSDDMRGNEFEMQQRAARRGFAPGRGVGRAIQQQSGAGSTCDAPDCKNPGGAFTSERDGQVYEFCSEACRAAFERPAA